MLAAVALLYAGGKFLQRYLLIRLLRMVRISVGELRDLLRQGAKPIVLDVRSAAARKLDPRRIPGAIFVDLAAPESTFPVVAPDRDVIVYCS